uniref:Embryo surrounding factor 1 brassicaceae domain-containing protein n=1 Tax=Nelumbo nucifera TaxID=4432 RepID=A0A822ZDA0_NELNU|nr:TPA_asm: hypothetical protein HUJ06_001332 [Nelumbo nucifera]
MVLTFSLIVLVSLFALHEFSKTKRIVLDNSKIHVSPCFRAFCNSDISRCWCCITAPRPTKTCWDLRETCLQNCAPLQPPQPHPSP